MKTTFNRRSRREEAHFNQAARSVLAVALILFGLNLAASAEMPVTVTLDRNHPGAMISEDFVGLSFETELLLPASGGRHYFRSDNQPLIALFHQLGIRNLRIGGNTADRPAIA